MSDEIRRSPVQDAERVAEAFHESYERLAPQFSYKTRKASAVPWSEVPESNRALMIAVVSDLFERGVLDHIDALTDRVAELETALHEQHEHHRAALVRETALTAERDQQAITIDKLRAACERNDATIRRRTIERDALRALGEEMAEWIAGETLHGDQPELLSLGHPLRRWRDNSPLSAGAGDGV